MNVKTLNERLAAGARSWVRRYAVVFELEKPSDEIESVLIDMESKRQNPDLGKISKCIRQTKSGYLP